MPGIPDIALGTDELLFVSTETTFGVWTRPVSADAVRVKEITFGRDQERVTRDDKLGTRSHTERIKRKKTVEWTVRAYVVPSGIDPAVTATPPDIGDLMEALTGQETVNAGVDVRYELIRNQNISLTLHRICDHFSESLTGCVPNTCSVRWSGTDEPEIEFAGFGKEWVITASGDTGALAVITAQTLKVPHAENVCDVNSIIAFTDGVTTWDNGGIGYHISAVTDGTEPSVTITLGVNDALDFDEGGGELNATLTANVYDGTPTNTLDDLAADIETQLEATGADLYTVTYDADGDNQKFVITNDSQTTSFSILWATGTNTATSCASAIGFDNSADDTGAWSYTADDSVTDGLITTSEAGGWEFAFLTGIDILPFFPAPTVQGSPLDSLDGSIGVDSENFRTTEGAVEYNNNMEARNDIYGEESAIGFSVSGRREVTMSSTSYLEEQYARRLKDFIRFEDLHNVVIQFGSTPGRIFQMLMPEFEFDNNPFVVPDQAEATVEFTGMALDESGPPFEQEITYVWK
jgi:hypothetical protein